MISDSTKERLLAFRRERDWEQFHSLKNLAVSISIEAAELLELVQWVPDAEVARMAAERKPEFRAEIADVAIYLIYMAHDLGLDLDACVREKLAVNESKYPVEKARGRSEKYDRLG